MSIKQKKEVIDVSQTLLVITNSRILTCLSITNGKNTDCKMHSGGYIIYEHIFHEHFKNSPIIVVNNLKMEAKYGSNKRGRVHYASSVTLALLVKCTSLCI